LLKQILKEKGKKKGDQLLKTLGIEAKDVDKWLAVDVDGRVFAYSVALVEDYCSQHAAALDALIELNDPAIDVEFKRLNDKDVSNGFADEQKKPRAQSKNKTKNKKTKKK
jgi:hypothetical protein